MRTEDDIRQALDLEPDHDALTRLSGFADNLGGVRTETHLPRRRVMPLLAAAAVVVVAGGAITLVHAQHSSRAAGGHQLTAAQRRPTWNLRIGPVAGYSVTKESAASIGLATGALFSVTATSTKRPEQGKITTCPGPLNSCSQPPSGTTVQHLTVDGSPGMFLPGGHVDNHKQTAKGYRAHPWQAADDGDQPSLSWYAGDNTTVFIMGTFGFDPATYRYDNATAKKIMLRMASAISAGHRDAALMPFVLNDLPARVAPEAVRMGAGACIGYGTGPTSSVNDALGLVFTACRVRTGSTRTATIKAAQDLTMDEGESFEPHETAVVTHDFPDGTSIVIGIDTNASKIVSQQQAEQLAEHATVSPKLTDPSTWIVVG